MEALVTTALAQWAELVPRAEERQPPLYQQLHGAISRTNVLLMLAETAMVIMEVISTEIAAVQYTAMIFGDLLPPLRSRRIS
jgi:hypothetical protein